MAWPLAILAALSLLIGCSRDPAGEPAPQPAEAPPAVATSASTSPQRPPLTDRCGSLEGVSIWTFPRAPRPGAPMTLVAIASEPLEGELQVRRRESPIATSAERHGARPFHWLLQIEAAEEGPHEVRLATAAGTLCERVVVGATAPRASPPYAAVWAVERPWDRASENLYSVWIERLFDAPLDQQPVWKALYEVLRDPARNLLYDHLGLGEDHPDHASLIEPDCADLPYTLRAYFAFKLGLPFGWSRCTRGSGTSPPSCHKWGSSLTANDGSQSPIRRLGNFLRVRLANSVHSGTVRVRGDEDSGDFYPVRLDVGTLAPGTVYADPYGHILVVVKRIPQTDGAGGLLLAVDGQPDNTISRRRFWRGNFLFSNDPVFGGPGFKRFRPVVMGDGPRPLTNAEIAAHGDWGDFGLEQYALGDGDFHEAVEAVLSPEPRDPEKAFLATIQALDEQVRRRVVSVDNGVAHKKSHPGIIEMPEGAEIFETTGDWEDYSTPSRDMRLLIAIDVVRSMPQRVVAHPQRWAMPSGVSPDELSRRLEAMLTDETVRRRFTYTRSDGSSWELRLADVLERARELEMAYNPNDCPERRWAAPDGSEEASTCRAQAPAPQRARMESHRGWFRDRRRPPRP